MIEKSPRAFSESELQQLLPERLSALFSFFEVNGLDGRLVGSLGRAAAIGENPPSLLTCEGVRDIDFAIMNLPSPDAGTTYAPEISRFMAPFNADEHLQGKIITMQESPVIRYKGIELPVNPKVFSRRIGRLYDIDIPTFDPNTHLHLPALYGPIRAKDWAVLLSYRRTLRHRTDILDENYFEPFHQLAAQRKAIYPNDDIIGDLRWQYHKYIPYNQRVILSYAVKPIRALFEKCGWWLEAPHS